ncbi:hypothetical protein [Okeania sp. SIO1I7]|uniref:hypothetical protein n=1 Tax=Okeania sp. SIO1I7 TaxID=2607772 RepID=UPI0013FCC8CE|nr:hypothetical protein [Okeania sp. SIO1I7]NET28353.1 hypothetical protein [Okeania sp. SIO1I7]
MLNIKKLMKLSFVGITGATVTCFHLLLTTSQALADSPLTSTPFSKAYQDVEIVQHAIEDGFDIKTIKALGDPDISNDVRVAIINQLIMTAVKKHGWFHNNYYTEIYLGYLAIKYGIKYTEITPSLLTAEEALSLGYLVAFRQRFAIKENFKIRDEELEINALNLTNKALAQNQEDFAVAVVNSLVVAHQYFRLGTNNWCKVYQTFNSVDQEFSSENRNMRPEAVDIIKNYINVYQEYCQN